MKGPSTQDHNLVHEGRRGRLIQLKPGESPPSGATVVNWTSLSHLREQEICKLPLRYSWSSKFGHYCTAASTGLFLGVITSSLRWKLKLYGSRGSWAGFGLVPVFAGCTQSLILTQLYIQKGVFEDRLKCEVCWPLRASVVNATGGAFLPMTLAVYTAYYHSRRLASYDLPKLFDSKENNQLLIKKFRDIMRPYKQHYLMSFFVLLLVPFLVTAHQQSIVRSLNRGEFKYPTPQPQKIPEIQEKGFSEDNSQTVNDKSNRVS